MISQNDSDTRVLPPYARDVGLSPLLFRPCCARKRPGTVEAIPS